jgi:hypothetical protein
LLSDVFTQLYAPVVAASNAIWVKPVRTFADIVMRAIVASYWNASRDLVDYDGPAYPDDVLARDPPITTRLDVASIAYLMRGIMDLAGIEFDVDGRLRSGAPNRMR